MVFFLYVYFSYCSMSDEERYRRSHRRLSPYGEEEPENSYEDRRYDDRRGRRSYDVEDNASIRKNTQSNQMKNSPKRRSKGRFKEKYKLVDYILVRSLYNERLR